jgi:aminopeptidase N
LRDVMGEDAFARFLQDYSTGNRSGFVTRDDFFAAVQSQTSVEITSLIDRYFRNKGS